MRTFARVAWLLLLERVLTVRLWALRLADRIRRLWTVAAGWVSLRLKESGVRWWRAGLPEGGWLRELTATLTAVAAGGVAGGLVMWAALALPWWA